MNLERFKVGSQPEMLSYHPWPTKSWNERMLQRGWRTVDTVDMRRVAAGITLYPWSPCIWRDGDKRNANFLYADLIALDFDSPEMPLAQALNAFSDMAHVIGTTKSHQREKNGVVCDRFRVVLRLDSRIERLDDFRETLRFAMRHYPADEACKDGGRFFWPCKEIVSVETDGFTCDVQFAPPPSAAFELTAAQASGVMPKSAARLLEGWIEVDRHKSVYLAGWDLGLAGWAPEQAVALVRGAPLYRSLPKRQHEFERTIADACGSGLVKRAELSQPVFSSHE